MKNFKSNEIKIKFCKQEIPILNDAKFEVKLDELNKRISFRLCHNKWLILTRNSV